MPMEGLGHTDPAAIVVDCAHLADKLPMRRGRVCISTSRKQWRTVVVALHVPQCASEAASNDLIVSAVAESEALLSKVAPHHAYTLPQALKRGVVAACACMREHTGDGGEARRYHGRGRSRVRLYRW